MTDGPIFTGVPKMPYAFKYAVVHNSSGVVEAFFVGKTLADKAANDWNATIGESKVLFSVCKIFPEGD